MLLFGREIRIPLETIIPSAEDQTTEEGDYVKDLRERLHAVWAQAHKRVEQGKLKIAARREKEVNEFDNKVGDAVS
jgi:ElaB/YqjD/DUF883 family membrane-anchored ribosome-binding protein